MDVAEPGKQGRPGDPLAPLPHPTPLLSRTQERAAVILGYHTLAELWGSSQVPTKNMEPVEAELPSETWARK